ncbi:MAG: YjjG family noncanonical pyrimidine nucleotidase [Clostridia bacterium]|nr:YjjG family noncanonical pyrimidine nucleotidase [Clostridia bacterium]
MKKYTTLLFDADRTLFDFDAAERDAFGIVMASHGIELSEREFCRYVDINAELWEQLGRGEITKEYLQDNRFGIFFQKIGRTVSVESSRLNLEYVDALADCSTLFEGALELCRELSGYFELYIVTNGVSHTQKKRFYASPIREYFRDIFVSEDAGAAKPMREYFDYVFSNIGQAKREGSLIIGDSLAHDILGGINAGIDTVWYNPGNTLNSTDIIPGAVIHSYDELRRVLLQ